MDPINPVAGNPESLNQNPQTPTMPKDNHGITIAAMAIFVLLALGAVAFLYYQNQQLKNLIASYQTPSSSPAPIATENPTADWKIYVDNQSGFSFKYPQSVTLKIGQKDLSFKDSTGNFQTTISWNTPPITGTLEEEIITRDSCPTSVTTGILPGPIPNSLRCDFTKSQYASVDIWVQNGTKIYKADISAINPNQPIPQGQIDLLSEIVGTFKFSTATSSPSAGLSCTYNSKIYKNGEGFKASDGCNSCSCVNGQVACTLMACTQ